MFLEFFKWFFGLSLIFPLLFSTGCATGAKSTVVGRQQKGLEFFNSFGIRYNTENLTDDGQPSVSETTSYLGSGKGGTE